MEEMRAEIATGGELAAVNRARTMKERSGAEATDFFGEFGDWSKCSAVFALEHARFLLKAGEASRALCVLKEHERVEATSVPLLALIVECLLYTGRSADAVEKLRSIPAERGEKATGLWTNVFSAALACGDRDAIFSVLKRFAKADPVSVPRAYLSAARHFRDKADVDHAIVMYRQAWDERRLNDAGLELSELLVEQHRIDEALQIMALIVPVAVREKRMLDRVKMMTGFISVAPDAVAPVS